MYPVAKCSDNNNTNSKFIYIVPNSTLMYSQSALHNQNNVDKTQHSNATMRDQSSDPSHHERMLYHSCVVGYNDMVKTIL